jgi:DNA-binding NtrC family response regulator
MAKDFPVVEACLVLRGVPPSLWCFPILRRPQKIGRQASCEIRVGDRGVSREHSVVWQEGGELRIRDLGSSNGTRVNGELITETVLRLGDTIQLDEIVLEVRDPRDPSSDFGNRTTFVLADNSSAVDLSSVRSDRLPLREEIASLYSLGGTLGSCSQRPEALRYFLDWLREWLGVDLAAAIFHTKGSFRVEAQSASSGRAATARIRWRAVQATFAKHHKELPKQEESAGPDEPAVANDHKLLVVWIPDVKPQGVIYAEWNAGVSDQKQGYPELIHAATQVLGSALNRLRSAHAETTGSDVVRRRRRQADTEKITLVGGELMLPVFDFIRKSAAVDATVLVTGETGTGKELVARAIHRTSPRAKAPFIIRNCATLPESLFENELFGHEPGAFTGAAKRYQGVFEQADLGSLFLDEIGEIPLHLQSKLLRVMEEQTLQRIGGGEEVQVNVRLITATNRNLTEMVKDRLFRQDLYYRLQVLVIHLPPLRERPDDVRRLATHFLQLACKRVGMSNVELSAESLKKLEAHNWPGNVRELRNTIERALILSEGQTIAPEHILITESPGILAPIKSNPSIRLDDLERQHILKVLASVGGNKAKAASILGIDRTTLHRKLQKLHDEAPAG